ncbi:hypothetical protein BKA62DRAFT_737935 [Auriculariales sp. MPI-PUGE-AT-0066]|nr:hypothetical protein BKA62DRAFT_737935 [Auriculariales sp. MPI-PUGE-AT-0066]
MRMPRQSAVVVIAVLANLLLRLSPRRRLTNLNLITPSLLFVPKWTDFLLFFQLLFFQYLCALIRRARSASANPTIIPSRSTVSCVCASMPDFRYAPTESQAYCLSGLCPCSCRPGKTCISTGQQTRTLR